MSLGEKIVSHFYRLTWRTPLHALRLRGRYPLKLLAVPDDPVRGDAARGAALIERSFTWRGETLPFGETGFDGFEAGQASLARAHSFAWLRDLAAGGDRTQSVPMAEALVRSWLNTHGDKISEPAWRPDNAGRRIIYWSSYAPLILSSGDLVYRSSVLNHLARAARHLDQTADRASVGLPRIAAWSGVVAAGLLMAGGNPRRAFGEAGLANALQTGMTSDGGIVCRTPGTQLDLVDLLAMLGRFYVSRKLAVPDFIDDAMARALPALMGVVAGDGGLSSWQGSVPVPRAEIDAVIEATGLKTRALRQAREWGYQRLSAGNTILICDAAPPPLGRVVQGGCASSLATEVSDGEHRLIVNCGGAQAGSLAKMPSLADGLRTTAAHSTMTLADSNSTAIHPSGALGKGVSEIDLDRQESDHGSKIEASHDGYVRRFGLIHKRAVALSVDGREVRGEDTLYPAERKKPQRATFAVRFHLAPHVDASLTADSMGALLRIEKGPLWQFRCRGGLLSIDESIWIDGAGQIQGTRQLVVSGEAASGGASIGWVLKRAG